MEAAVETSYTVWFKRTPENEWEPDLNAAGMVHSHSLNSAIKTERYLQRMHGFKTQRLPNKVI